QPVAVNISGKKANAEFRTVAANTNLPVSTILKDERQRKRKAITYLTALEASKIGLDKSIKSFEPIAPCTNPDCFKAKSPTTYERYDTGDENGQNLKYRKKHHISEITVTDESGKRSVYGVPVYNVSQAEYSFAIGKPGTY